MERSKLFTYLGALLVLTVLAVFAYERFVRDTRYSPVTPIQITWLFPHPPKALFERSAKTFARELYKESGGELVLKETVLPADVLGAGYETRTHTFTDYVDKESSVNPRMASEYVGHLGGTNLFEIRVLDLPFLFDDYDSALKFLDGPAGLQLLEDFSSKIPEYKLLAFTMSGGFRIFVSKEKKIETPNDLKGMRIVGGAGGPVIQSTIRAFGATPEHAPGLEFRPETANLDAADAAETSYSRLEPLLKVKPEFIKYVTETNHSLSLTIVLVTKDFYESLSPKNREALEKTIRHAARLEKEDNIAYDNTVRELLKKNGATIITPTKDEREAFRVATLPVRVALDPQFGDLVERITTSLESQ